LQKGDEEKYIFMLEFGSEGYVLTILDFDLFSAMFYFYLVYERLHQKVAHQELAGMKILLMI